MTSSQTQQPVSGAMTDFTQWLNTQRDLDVSAAFHEIVAHVTVLLSRAQNAQAVRNAALEAIKANHEHHKTYDDYGGYPESELCEQNIAAIAALETLQSAPAQPVERKDAVELPALPETKGPYIDIGYTADQMRDYALAAIAANQPQRGNAQEPVARKFVGVGELERTGYIPAGSAAEREAVNAAAPQSDAQQSEKE